MLFVLNVCNSDLIHALYFFYFTVMNLVEKMLTFNSKQRITAEEALQHPYLKDYCCPADEPVASQPFYIEHEVRNLCLKNKHYPNTSIYIMIFLGSVVSSHKN